MPTTHAGIVNRQGASEIITPYNSGGRRSFEVDLHISIADLEDEIGDALSVHGRRGIYAVRLVQTRGR